MSNKFASFVRGYGFGQKMVDDYEKSQEKRDLAKIINEKPVESTGFTADQGAQLEAAAKTGLYDIGYDEASKAYTVAPKSDPGQVGRVSMQGVTDFLGNRTVGRLDEGQVNSARMRAMAGVLGKSDPLQGARLMREATQGERDDKRFGWESARNERDGRLAQEADAEKELTKQIETEAGDWFKKRLVGPDGAERPPTVDDYLASSQYRASRLLAAGKADAAGQVMKDFNAQSLIKIQLEGAQRSEAIGRVAAAASAGDLGAVKDFYNQFIPDGARVTDVQRGAGGQIVIQRETADGRPMPPTTMKDTGQLLSALTTFKDPMALYNWSQNEFKNNLAIKADQRADRSLDIQAATAARANVDPGQKKLQELRILLGRDPTPEERRAAAGLKGEEESAGSLANKVIEGGVKAGTINVKDVPKVRQELMTQFASEKQIQQVRAALGKAKAEGKLDEAIATLRKDGMSDAEISALGVEFPKADKTPANRGTPANNSAVRPAQPPSMVDTMSEQTLRQVAAIPGHQLQRDAMARLQQIQARRDNAYTYDVQFPQ